MPIRKENSTIYYFRQCNDNTVNPYPNPMNQCHIFEWINNGRETVRFNIKRLKEEQHHLFRVEYQNTAGRYTIRFVNNRYYWGQAEQNVFDLSRYIIKK